MAHRVQVLTGVDDVRHQKPMKDNYVNLIVQFKHILLPVYRLSFPY